MSKEKQDPLEALFQDWSQTDPKEGVSHLHISAQNIGNVPGVLDHWDWDIKKRKKEILAWKKRSLLTKATSMLSKSHAPKGVSGEDIAHYNAISPVIKLVEDLKRNPSDYETRIQLISSVAKSKQEISTEGYRDLLLQVSVAHTFGVFSIQGIQMANWVQMAYFQSLLSKCRHGLRILELRTEGGPIRDADSGQKEILEKIKNLIDQNLRILQTYIIHAGKGETPTNHPFKGIFRIEDNWDKILSGESSPDEKNELLLRANAIIHYLRYHTLISPYAHLIPDTLVKMEPNHPLGYFLKGRILMSNLVYRVSRYGAEGITENSKKNVQIMFKETYHQYTQAVKKAGGHYKSGSHEMTILIEYIRALRFFINKVAETIKLKLPKPWVIDNLSRAMMLLKQTGSNDKEILNLLYELEYDLKGWL